MFRTIATWPGGRAPSRPFGYRNLPRRFKKLPRQGATMCAVILDCTDSDARADSIAAAADVVRSGRLIVMPTDTVYGVGADAFDKVAVAMVLAAKHRSRDMPPPVLVPNTRTVDGLATDVPMYAKILMRAFWPGALTIVLKAQGSLSWDLGKTNGTVALRMPDDALALEVLSEIGPMAVTSANLSGQPAATTASDAHQQLGGAVSVYLDGGPRVEQGASTIIDCTGPEPIVLREGSISTHALQQVLGDTPLLLERPAVEVLDDPQSTDNPPTQTNDGRRSGRGPRLVGSVRPSGVRAGRDTVSRVAANPFPAKVSALTVDIDPPDALPDT